MFSYQAKASNKGSLCLCFRYLHAQRHLLLGIVFIMSLVAVIFEFCIISAELLSRHQALSLQVSSRLALHVDQTHKSQYDDLNYLSSSRAHILKRRYSLSELKTMLTNARANVNNDVGTLVTTEYTSYDKLNVKWLENNEKGTENIPDESIQVPNNDVLDIDSPTISMDSNNMEHFPVHVSATEDNLYSIQGSPDHRLPVYPQIGDQSGANVPQPSHIMPTSNTNIPGRDPQTLSMGSNSIEQLPKHDTTTGNKLYLTQGYLSNQLPVDSQIRDRSSLNGVSKLISDLAKVSLSKKKKSKKPLELPKDYPLFESPYSPPVVDGHTCRDSLCSEFLQSIDLHSYKTCLARQRSVPRYDDSKPGPCHFINSTKRAAVALASFPGSGNTWVRGLLEKATGVCTGAIYCDKSIRASGMNGEAIKSGAVIAVKTHKSKKVAWTDQYSPQALNNGKVSIHAFHNCYDSIMVPAYGSVILVIRNPYRALIAEWNRLNAVWHNATTNFNHSNGHVGTTEKEQFGKNGVWQSFIKRKLPVWQAYFQEWVVEGHRHNKSVLVVRYEDLKQDTFKEVKRMLDFLRFEYREDELRQRLAADFSTFQRQHQETFEHFTMEQRHIVDSAIAASIDYLKLYNSGDSLRLVDYLGTIA